ncbi:MAG: fatty acid desaturase [Burkholderiales bacterium]
MKGINRFVFVIGLAIPLVPVLAFYSGDYYHTVALTPLLGIPVLDYLIGPRYSRPDAAQTSRLEQENYFRLIPILYVPLQLAVQIWGAWMACRPEVPAEIRIAICLGIGYASGAIGITAAHELGHKKSPAERTLSKILLLSVCYGHFYIEHNRGHHVRVGTRDDPATARRDEDVYLFVARGHRLLAACVGAGILAP